MSDTIKFQNSMLISQSRMLSECCCDTATGIFWESVPCPLNNDPRDSICYEWDQCQFTDRMFVNYENRCGGTVSICEAQRLRINRFDLVFYPTTYTDIIRFEFTGGLGTVGQVVWTSTTVTLSTTGMDDIVVSLGTSTCSEIVSLLNSEVGSVQSGRWAISVSNPLFDPIGATAVNPETLDFNPSEVDWVNSRTSGLYLDFNGTEIYVIPDPDITTFASNLQFALQSAIGAGISVTVNYSLSDLFSGGAIPPYNVVFDILFGGALCGSDQSRITTLVNIMPGASDVWQYHDSDLTDSYLDPQSYSKQYTIFGTGSDCPYESTANDGPAYYNGTQCCPQKGLTLGSNQNIVDTVSGYCLSSCLGNGPFDNLENTYYLNGQCYSMTKSFFLFGMDGRLQTDYEFNRMLHITPECNYPSECDSSVPCDCTPELFIPMWNKNVPWGPFGSYYKDIELAAHPAWTEPYNTALNPYGHGYQSYLSSGFPTPRSGWDYRPYGYIQTIGEWTETKEIGIYFYAFRPIPFAVGDNEFDDLDQYIEIDPASIDASLTVTQSAGSGCGPIQIGFLCSGKTIGNYLDAINALEIKDTSGCKPFAFCAASSAARSMPASKIINTSAEIFESNTAGWYGDSLGTPILDADLRSGSHLVMPKAYEKYFAGSLLNNSIDIGGPVTQYYQPLDPGPNAVASTPPLCRAVVQHLPKESDFYGLAARGNSMWWTTMPVCRTAVANVGLQVLDPAVDPHFTTSWVKVATGIVTLFASGLHVATTGINTRPNAEYTVQDFIDTVNALSFTWASGTYTPFTGATNMVNQVWLDDVTSINGASYTYDTSVPSLYNFSYREPLLDLAQTEISQSVYAPLESDVRRRCYWGELGDNDIVAAPCVAPDANRTAGIGLNCVGDQVIDGSWIVSQGCTSSNCLTQWYIPATRCSCSTVLRCSEGGVVTRSHPFNQPYNGLNEDYWNAAGWTNVSVYQPLLYVCEYDFHPECDIPCMVKVPFVVINPDGSIHFQNGSESALPAALEFCSDELGAIYSNNQGWCQYFDPSTPKVMESEIPRAAYPLAFLATRTAGAFCSTNPWNFDPKTTRKGTVPSSLAVPLGSPSYFNFPDGCVDVGDPGYADAVDCGMPDAPYPCFSCAGWDRICNLGIVYEEVIDFIADPTYLCALFRPILTNTTAEDVCTGNSYGCNRIDIDCSTACCECGFSCSPGSTCLDAKNGGYYTRTVAYSYDLSSDSEGSCDISLAVGGGCELSYAPGVCISTLPNACNKPNCYTNSVLTTTFSVDVNYNITSCGCDLATPVCANQTYSQVSDCGYTMTCGAAGCLTTSAPALPPDEVICYTCASSLGCLNQSTGTVNTTGVISYNDFCGDRPGWGISRTTYTSTTSTFSSTTPDVCDGAYSCNSTVDTATTIITSNGDSECASPASIDLVGSVAESYTLGSMSWNSCSEPSLAGISKTLEYVWDWESTHGFACGYGNLFLSGSGQLDSRFFGHYCT